MSNMTNITVQVPAGSILYGNQLCTPPSWTDFLTFYLANYVTHLGTIQLYPGEHGLNKWLTLIAALLLPVAGLGKGLDRMVRCARFGKTKLEKAARAGALCMVVRDWNWQPCHTDTLVDLASGDAATTDDAEHSGFHRSIGASFDIIRGELQSSNQHKITADLTYHEGQTSSKRLAKCRVYDPYWLYEHSKWWSYFGVDTGRISAARDFHGSIQHKLADNSINSGLPLGYRLAFVPHSARVETLEPQSPSITTSARGAKAFSPEDNINSSTESLSILSAVVQLLFGLTTLYNSVGPQIDHFGYAAFGLTVFQYSLMSLINLLASLVCPSYDQVYMVESDIMHEAIGRGAIIHGIVGRLVVGPGLVHNFTETSHLCTLTMEQNAAQLQATAGAASQDKIAKVDHEVKALDATEIEIASAADSSPKATVTVNCKQSPHQILVFTVSACLTRIMSNNQVLLRRRKMRQWKTELEQELNRDDKALDYVFVPSHTAFERHGGWNYSSKDMAEYTSFGICLAVGSIPLIPIGLLTGFRAQESTYAQRVIIMLWFAMGVFAGALIAQLDVDPKSVLQGYEAKENMESEKSGDIAERDMWVGAGSRFNYILTVSLFAAPGVAGLAVAGMMFVSFGNCNTIG